MPPGKNKENWNTELLLCQKYLSLVELQNRIVCFSVSSSITIDQNMYVMKDISVHNLIRMIYYVIYVLPLIWVLSPLAT